MIIKQSLINNWASAISSIAIENNNIKEYIELSNKIRKLFMENEELSIFLKNNFIDLNIRFNFLDKVFLNTNLDKNLLNVLKLLTERNLISATKSIFKKVEFNLLKAIEISKGYVYSVEKLDEKLIKELELKLSKKLNQTITLENLIDKSLIAGIKVEINDHRFDSSIKGKIEDMKLQILQNRK